MFFLVTHMKREVSFVTALVIKRQSNIELVIMDNFVVKYFVKLVREKIAGPI